MAMRDAALEALLIETRGTLSASPLAAPLPDDRQRELERRCRHVIEAKPHLELAAWLAESWTFSRGLEGLLEGLRLITELLDVRWDELFPLEEDDERDRLRKGQLSSLDAQLSRALLAVSLTAAWGGISLRGYLELRLFEGFSKEQLEEYARMQPDQPVDLQALIRAWSASRHDEWSAEHTLKRLGEVTAAMNEYARVMALERTRYPWCYYPYWGSSDLPRTREVVSRLERVVREATILPEVAPTEAEQEQVNEEAETFAAAAKTASVGLDPFQPANREEAVRLLWNATLFICSGDPDGFPCLLLERAVRLSIRSRSGWLADLKQLGRYQQDSSKL